MASWMEMVERMIAKGRKEGHFDNLKGKGKPLHLHDPSSPFVPDDVRTEFKILKNSGYIPPEVQRKKRIEELRAKERAGEISEDERKMLRNEELKFNLFMETRIRRR